MSTHANANNSSNTEATNSVNDNDSSSSSSSSRYVKLLKRIQKRYPGRKVTLFADVVHVENDKCTISFFYGENGNGKLDYYVYHHDHEEIDEAVKTDLDRAALWDGSSYPG
jgi:hypothetical protein